MATSSVHDQTKRRIESALSAFSPKKQRHSTQTQPVGTEARRKPTTGAETEVSSGGIGKFRPWSLEDLLERVATYKTYTWLVQSPALSPVRCARNGWINTDCSTLKCPQCSAILIAQIPDDLTDDEEVRWIGRLAQQLQLSHDDTCPWKNRACAANLYSAPLLTSREAVDDVCQCAASMLEFGDQLPATEQPLSAFQQGLLHDLKSRVVEIRKAVSQSEAAPGDAGVLSALSLALFGWRSDKTKPQPAVHCNMCFRSAGLWLFQSATVSDSGESAQELRPFNAVDEHRAFCYWARGSDVDSGQLEGASGSTSNTSTSETIPGWKKTVASLLRAKTMDSSSLRDPGDVGSNNGESKSSDGRNSDGAAKPASISTEGGSELLQKLKPFNISAISSAAEAFGIPFSMSQLALAMQKLGSSAAPPAAAEAVTRPATDALATATAAAVAAVEPTSDVSVLLRTSADGQTIIEDNTANVQSDWESEDIIRPYQSDGGDSATEPVDDDIPDPIDTSGLASLLDGSTLASALEDPTKAKAILEYVKGLLKAKNSQPQDAP